MDMDGMISYLMSWDLATFFHISVDSVGVLGSLYFCTLLGVKIGLGILRDALNI